MNSETDFIEEYGQLESLTEDPEMEFRDFDEAKKIELFTKLKELEALNTATVNHALEVLQNWEDADDQDKRAVAYLERVVRGVLNSELG